MSFRGPQRRLRDTDSDRWRWPCQQFGEPTKVLGDGCQRELELGSVRPTQSQPAEPQDAFQMREQHLNTLSFTTRLFERFGLGQRAGNVAGLFIDATRDYAERRLWATLGLEQAAATVDVLAR